MEETNDVAVIPFATLRAIKLHSAVACRVPKAAERGFRARFQMSKLSSVIRVVAALVVCALTVRAGAQRSVDLAQRDPAIHWPHAFDPRTAAMFAHNELFVQADCHRVWVRMLDVTEWPNWFVLVKDVTIDGSESRVKAGTLIRLKIFGYPITSRIDEFVPDARLSWFPQGMKESAPKHYHTWHFVPEGKGCRVTTEETGIGPDDVKAPEAGSRMVHRAHDLWLASLRWTSEQ